MSKKNVKFITGVCTLCLLLLSMICIPNYVTAKDNIKREKVIISIKIEEGDSLWSLAKKYKTPECGSIRKYVKEIREANALSSDTIHSGNYLIIPCYVESYNSQAIKER